MKGKGFANRAAIKNRAARQRKRFNRKKKILGEGGKESRAWEILCFFGWESIRGETTTKRHVA